MKKVLFSFLSIIILGSLFYKELQIKGANLISPGKLSLSHAQIDKSGKCDACHTRGKQIDTEKCLACHKEIEERKETHSGFHGKTTKECINCHTEHYGRSTDITYFDEKHFDHSVTGWTLEGIHKKLQCQACHSKKNYLNGKKNYLMVSAECVFCHQKDDIHHGENGRDCAECHNQDSFKVD
jgi:hypothetical protein